MPWLATWSKRTRNGGEDQRTSIFIDLRTLSPLLTQVKIYKLVPNNSTNINKIGSELAAETAAALAASSILFEDSAIRQRQLNHAKQLFNFANNYRGDYSKAVPQAAESYR